MITRAEALARATTTLEQAGVPGAERDATRLLAQALGLETASLRAHISDPIDAEAQSAFRDMVAQRATRKPVAQILGYRDFWEHRFKVTPDVLDPRPDTETLVERALSEPFSNVLDLGTGSGCILTSLVAARPEATGLGTDVSEKALAVANQNAHDIGVAGRVRFSVSDWFDAVEGRFDLIVSNPPYIALSEMAGLDPDVRNHEPSGALTDGADGLSNYKTIAAQAPANLLPEGRVLVEIGSTQGAAVKEIFTKAGWNEVRVQSDLNGRDRVVSARKTRSDGHNLA